LREEKHMFERICEFVFFSSCK